MKALKIEIEKRLPPEANLWQVFASVGFWNENGQRVYDENRAGKMGSKFTQGEAKRLSFEEFVLNSLNSDIETLKSSTRLPNKYWEPGFTHGKGGSHIWVSNPKNERVLFIHF